MNDNLTRTFQGRWITNEKFAALKPVNVFCRQLEKPVLPQKAPTNCHILFRKKFDINKVEPTVAYISADDYYKLYVNGELAGQGPCPGYPFYYYYNEIDITKYLKPGKNIIAVHTYYQGLVNRVWVSGDLRHGLILDVVAGKQTIVKSDDTFLVGIHTGFSRVGIAGYKTQYLERYNSGAREVGFEKISFNDSAWKCAQYRQYADYILFKQPTKQLEIENIPPVEIKKTEQKIFVDFGGMYVGNLTAIARGGKGDDIIIRCSQELDDNGNLRYKLRANCEYVEKWALSGGKDRLVQYDYKSFRYAEFILPNGCELTEDEIFLVARHYPFKLKAWSLYRDLKSKKIWDLCVRSLKYGVQDVIQDCMEREKGQYLGDGCYSAMAYSLATGDYAIAKKLIDDSLRSAFINKGLMTCSTCSFMQEIAEFPLILPLLVLMYGRETGDLKSLLQWYQPLTDILEFYREQYEGEDGLLYDLDKWCVVEWPAKFRDGYDHDLTEGRVCEGTHNVINAYYIGAIKMVNGIARMIDKQPYREPHRLIEAYIDTFYDPEQMLFCDSPNSSHISMPGNLIPFMYGIYPDLKTEKKIVQMICEKRLSSSMFFVTFAMLFGLKRIKREDLMLDLILDPGGWLRMIDEGATATFEGWGKDCKQNISLFHLTLTYALIFLIDWDLEGLTKAF